MATGLDGQVYAMTGDQGAGQASNIVQGLKHPITLLQNNNEGEFDDTGVIIRVGLDKDVITPKYAENPLDHYYAIGIRNGFGLAVDPVTGNLWDTENGEIFFDEINLVSENFNSGWAVTMGPGFETNGAEGDLANLEGQIEDLLNFNKYTYAEPKFSWEKTITPTGLTFPNSEAFDKYGNELFVGDCNGKIWNFKLNDERTDFIFDSAHLQDLAANIVTNESGENIVEPLDEIEFGSGFGCITDIEFGPDGNLYIVSLSDGIIYRIVPVE
jgi:glucose/arabinose dehydrogenase